MPVHVHVGNPGMRLLPGMFVNATFVSRTEKATTVLPRSAVLDAGTRKIVYLARPNGVFEAREVEVGAPSEELFPVVRGVAPGDKVVLNGNFLIDSQANLSSGMTGMFGGSKEFAGGASPTTDTAPGAGNGPNTPAFKLEFESDSNPMKVGVESSFTARLTGPNGKPAPGAHVEVALVMPAMPSMNMPEMKSSFELKWDAGRTHAGRGRTRHAGNVECYCRGEPGRQDRRDQSPAPERPVGAGMINRILDFSLKNRWLILAIYAGLAAWGYWALLHTPIDAIPDLSENQVIVFTEWQGRSPQEVEDQITYPLTVNLQGLPHVRTVRSSSAFGFSMVNVIFEDSVDIYFARTRVLERLSLAGSFLPAGVTPMMGPDATGVGQVFWYTVEGPYDSGTLRSIEDWYIKYQLNSVPGVAEVASVGGFGSSTRSIWTPSSCARTTSG